MEEAKINIFTYQNTYRSTNVYNKKIDFQFNKYKIIENNQMDKYYNNKIIITK